jgi:hypothetical protein
LEKVKGRCLELGAKVVECVVMDVAVEEDVKKGLEFVGEYTYFFLPYGI